MTENKNLKEKEDDDSNLYDFLEVFADKVDAITRRIEGHKDDSQQRWQRTKDDIDEQKRLLKSQLQRRIHILSENLNKPDFIRIRDKITFTVSVANICFSPLLASRWPHILPIFYTMQALFLITLRFFIYKHKHWHYFVYDLCYFVNLLTLIYLWILPSSEILFTVCYTLSHGPLILAIILWNNSLVFHSLDKITSMFIHMYPPLTLFTLRWILPIDLQVKHYPAIIKIGSTLPLGTAVFYTVVFYLIWQVLYYAFIVYGRRDKVASGSRVTSYTWLLNDKKGFLAHLMDKFGFGGEDNGINPAKLIFYFFLQFAYMLISILPACLWFYQYMYINGIFICLIFAFSVYNGASYYIDVFSRQYIKSLKLLHDLDNSNDKNASPSTETDADKNQDKKHS